MPLTFRTGTWVFKPRSVATATTLAAAITPKLIDSVSIGHAVIGKLEYHVEFFSNVSTEQNSDWVGTVDTWFTYQVNENLIFDSGCYIGVTAAADDWHPWVGMTWRY